MLTNSFTAVFEIRGDHGEAHSHGKQLVREAFDTHNWGISSHLNSIEGSTVTDNDGEMCTVKVDFTVRFDGSPSDVQEEFVNDVSVCKEVRVN